MAGGLNEGGEPRMSQSPDVASRRARNATATRMAILAAARARFARDSYERVGVREIAADAGVNAALVIRYFRSKEQLFAAAIAQDLGLSELLAGELDGLGERIVRHFVQQWDDGTALDPLLIVLLSAANQQAAEMVYHSLTAQFVEPLARRLSGDDALLRATLIGAQLLGLAIMRNVMRSEPLASSAAERLVALVGPTVQSYLDGSAGS
jgi:AcrR family transcriptional regulator